MDIGEYGWILVDVCGYGAQRDRSCSVWCTCVETSYGFLTSRGGALANFSAGHAGFIQDIKRVHTGCIEDI